MKFFEKAPAIRVGHYFVEATKQIGYGVPLFADIDFTDEMLANGYTAVDSAGEARFVLPGWPDEPNTEEDGKTLRALTRDLYLDLRHPASHWPDKRNVVEAAVEQTMKLLRATDHGDVLVFMPNRDMVTDVQSRVRVAVEDDKDAVGKVHAYWLMRDTPRNEKRVALATCSEGERKVVVASNLAETSLTIAGIKYVVDAGLVIQAEWDPDLAVSHAPLKAHSQSGIRQRWGRVGRKTHGWVFPLYSLQDYLAMPRDTPAGSTQTNLEGMILKLIAAGEDPSAVVFPADFEADGVFRDDFAQQSANNFRRERARALAAAQTNGAIRPDGKTLTRLGVELTRSRASSEKAIALMFADRLACVPEVAMVLVALAGRVDNESNRGHLAGPERILAADRKWPVEWNVHARRCHEALAIGCQDDLDFVIRVFAEWEAASDPSAWCAQWWVNEDVLRDLRLAASKLMDSLAPGMSREAKRALDPRLAGRARAVLSRALGSLRYVRSTGRMWQSANPGQPDPVVVPEGRLLPAADQVIGLVRSRPNEQWAGQIKREGELLGLVSWLPWAADGEPSDFELLRRVSLRRAELQEFSDPAQQLRAKYPIGARVRVNGDLSGTSSLRKLTDGFARPTTQPDAEHESDESATSGESELVFTSETRASDSGPSRAGSEFPEEEARLIPIPIAELETDELEDFSGHHSAVSAVNTMVTRSEPASSYEATANWQVDTSEEWYGIVRGYQLAGPGLQILMDPVSADEPPAHEVGETVQVVTVGPIDTHVGSACELRECDQNGTPRLAPPIHIDGATIDEVRGPDATALQPGSIWTLTRVPGRYDYISARLSAADSVFTRITSDPVAIAKIRHPTIASFTGVLTGERYRDRRQQQYAIATTDAFGPNLVPEFSIWLGRLEKAGIAPIAGAHIKIELSANTFPRSGRWNPEDVERLLGEHGTTFSPGGKPEHFGLLPSSSPLSVENLQHLLAVDPLSSEYGRNAWTLWETSHQFTVRRVSAIATAMIPSNVAESIRSNISLEGLKRHYHVSIDIQRSGAVNVSGKASDVEAVIDELKSTVLGGGIIVHLPARPDGTYNRYPNSYEVSEALQSMADIGEVVAKQYMPASGKLRLDVRVADRKAEILTQLSASFSFYCVRLRFSNWRGFASFQRKERWLEVCSGLDGVGRWVVTPGSTWGIFAKSVEDCKALLARLTSRYAPSSLHVSRIEGREPSVDDGPALTDTFDIRYSTPKSESIAAEEREAIDADRPTTGQRQTIEIEDSDELSSVPFLVERDLDVAVNLELFPERTRAPSAAYLLGVASSVAGGVLKTTDQGLLSIVWPNRPSRPGLNFDGKWTEHVVSDFDAAVDDVARAARLGRNVAVEMTEASTEVRQLVSMFLAGLASGLNLRFEIVNQGGEARLYRS